MLAAFIRWMAGWHRSDRYERAFVSGIRTPAAPRSPRNRRVERILIAGWVIIAVKCVLVAWLFGLYRIPVNPLWVIAPTVVFAALVTAVYLLRD